MNQRAALKSANSLRGLKLLIQRSHWIFPTVVIFVLILLISSLEVRAGTGDRSSASSGSGQSRNKDSQPPQYRFCGSENAKHIANNVVRAVTKELPKGGKYNRGTDSLRAVNDLIDDSGKFHIRPSEEKKFPAMCSTATYLALLKTLELEGAPITKEISDRLRIGKPTRDAPKSVGGQLDGMGVWGRVNANGPGLAKFFADANLGSNLLVSKKEDIHSVEFWKNIAPPGTFMKMWWSDDIGGNKEHGHSVVFLGVGSIKVDGETKPCIKYWSGNSEGGLSEACKVIDDRDEKLKIQNVAFSCLESPKNIVNVLRPEFSKEKGREDKFLAGLKSERGGQASPVEVVRKQIKSLPAPKSELNRHSEAAPSDSESGVSAKGIG